MCKAGNFNLSYESLTSHEIRQTLRDLPQTDPTLFAEISQPRSRLAPILSDAECLHEDSEEVHGGFDAPDDTDVPLDEVEVHCEQIANGSAERAESDGALNMDYAYVPDEDGGLSCVADAEDASMECVGSGDVASNVGIVTTTGRPKRMRRPNVLYSDDQFESH